MSRLARNRRARLRHTADSLALRLEKLMSVAKASGQRQALVELRLALKEAKRMSRLLRQAKLDFAGYIAIIQAISFLVELVKRIHSFFNCLFRLVTFYANWDYHKDVEDNGRNEPSAASSSFKSVSFLPLPNRIEPAAGQHGAAAGNC
jgi:hypothetical protein